MFEITILRSLVLAIVVVVAFIASAFSNYSAKASDSSATLSLKSNFLDSESDVSDEDQFERAEQVAVAEAHPQALTIYQ